MIDLDFSKGNGLLPAIVQDFNSGKVLMLAYINNSSWEKTLATGEAHYWSRSRKILWHKGATSGLVQKVVDLRIDDDQDADWLKVEVAGSGASCHVGYMSCFYRSIPTGGKPSPDLELEFKEQTKIFDPEEVYGDAPNPTQL